jgi:dienelactone hydrolase
VAFEFSSGGDRVPGRLLLPAEAGSALPVVLLQHGAGGSKEADYLVATAGPWVRRGVAVASIDFPLHGERSDAKLSDRLWSALASRSAGEADVPLLDLLFRQALRDLHRAADALEALPQVDATRLAYAGFSLGSVIGCAFCARDARPRAAALALAGAGLAPSAWDATLHVGRIAPRPLLMVNTRGDEVFPRDRVEALFAAAAEPKELRWFDGPHNRLPGEALKAMWVFLEPHLEASSG